MSTRKRTDEPLAARYNWISYRLTVLASRFAKFVAPIYTTRHGLNVAAWRILANIARHQPLSQKELGEYTVTDAPKVTRALAELERRKYISREVDPNDRRRAVLRLTAKGRSVFEDVGSIITRADQALLEGLAPDERRALLSALEKMEKQMRDGRLSGSWRDFEG
jgi:DNA-binding MarR family transcriptional regulator